MTTQTKAMRRTNAETQGKQTAWRSLAWYGSLASWILLLYSLATMGILVLIGAQPASAEEGFRMLAENSLTGLLRLDVLSILVMPLYYVLFFALYTVLRRTGGSLVGLATLLVFAGLTLFLATPSAFSWLSLSDRYAGATSETQRSQLIAAGEAILASDMWHGSGAVVGGCLLQIGTVLVSVAMLRSPAFGKFTAWTGIVTHGLDLIHIPLMMILPGLGTTLMAIAGPLYLLWFPFVARALARLAQQEDVAPQELNTLFVTERNTK